MSTRRRRKRAHASRDPRPSVIDALRDYRELDSRYLLPAIYVLREHPAPGDEALLYPLLDSTDDDVVAEALYTLCVYYEQFERLRPFIVQAAFGDPRDPDGFTIQRTAIELLGRLASHDQQALEVLWQVAENRKTSPYALADVWEWLAKHYRVPWSSKDYKLILWLGLTQETEPIRARIRKARDAGTV